MKETRKLQYWVKKISYKQRELKKYLLRLENLPEIRVLGMSLAVQICFKMLLNLVKVGSSS